MLSRISQAHISFAIRSFARSVSSRLFAPCIVACAALCVPRVAESQQRVSDLKDALSFNGDRKCAPRAIAYWPSADTLVTQDGQNRYTRALYGGPTEFRLETSDRPIFATYRKRDYHNVRFFADGLPLEETDHCRAGYLAAKRTYKLTHGAWPAGAAVLVDALVAHDSETAIWRFILSGSKGMTLRAEVSDVANPKIKRNGDIGADPYASFDPMPNADPTATTVFELTDTLYLAFEAGKDVVSASTREAFETAEAQRRELVSRVRFDTPEPLVDMLGGLLIAAADGVWDGDTWLHGAVGWRMPLAGWRAAYAGDVLGWPDRASRHFDAYAQSQVVDVPPTLAHPQQDPNKAGARALKKWGTPMYSNGYICRYPRRRDVMHHYDMNLNYVDELLWHLQYDARPEVLETYWPVLERHIEWENRNFDPDGDGLYDAYCCIWASDALYYSGGGVTHSSAYMLRALRLVAKVAELTGRDAEPYRAMARRTEAAIDSLLWMEDKGHWAEYRDALGLRRLHPSAALWSVYVPIDCGVGSQEQRKRATSYVDDCIPHIPVEWVGQSRGLDRLAGLSTLSTSDWMPYAWSINNVAQAEVLNMSLAYFEAGRPDEGYRLLMAMVLDNMLCGASPGNFGQISHYDAARGECYRDFGDVVGVATRTLMQGLFGIVPQALDGVCVVRPGLPAQWDSASVVSPYLSYDFRRDGDTCRISVRQNFAQPLRIRFEMATDSGFVSVSGSDAQCQELSLFAPRRSGPNSIESARSARLTREEVKAGESADLLGALAALGKIKYKPMDISAGLNDSLPRIFEQSYLSPRPAATTLQIPYHGIGEWCHPTLSATVSDSALRSANGEFSANIPTPNGNVVVPFLTPAKGDNVAYVSLWDNYPNEVSIPIDGRGRALCLLMAGSSNHMQHRMEVAEVVVSYSDGSSERLPLIPPFNWCPIEQDYFTDGKAFDIATGVRPWRVAFSDGRVGQKLFADDSVVYGRDIEGGAATMLCLGLDKGKRLISITLRALGGDVVVGLVGATLIR